MAQPRATLFELYSGDCSHHALAQLRIQLLRTRLQIGLRKTNRFSENDRDRMKTQASAAPWQRVVGTKDPHRQDRRERLRDDKSQTGQCWLELAIERAGAFGKHDGSVAGFQDSD